jgi:hypothetical protein
MNPHAARRAVFLVGMALVATGCSAASSEGGAAGPGMSDLAPTYDARPSEQTSQGGQKEAPKKVRATRKRRAAAEAVTSPTPSPRRENSSGKGAGGGRTAAGQALDSAASGPVSIKDPSGDLSHSLEGSPASADIVRVQVTRRKGEIEVRTTFAATVPAKQTGGKSMNVASFYDVDDNGVIDYEVWASLADNGWGTGHLDRREEEATFGPATGIEVSVEGDTLVTTFPLDRIGDADVFRWSAASEWGSFESMAASTSARDYAPDDGSVGYPG